MMAIQKDGRTDSEAKRWQIDGVSPRTPLKPLSTNSAKRDLGEAAEGEEEDECSTTPVAEESRIPTRLPCPPAPRKRRPVKAQQIQINVFKEFFVPPTADLNSVFKPRFDS
ncbi:hypothetical protein Scep_017896 [Stephania cephalantha]|uniref:Uncharacterized protein n=1 Tax=Stephania cephalantha TaxID=152367 RepID=A0AAP0IQC7_9MAGN